MDPPLDNGSDSEEESLGPRAYQYTLSLLSDDKQTAPTRFELFQARKEFEDFLIRKRRLISEERKVRQIRQMHTALRECSDLFNSEIKGFPSTKLKHLLSKVLTRSMTANIKKLLAERLAIWTAFTEIKQRVFEVRYSDNLEQFSVIFVRDVNKLKERIMAIKPLQIQVSRYLES